MKLERFVYAIAAVLVTGTFVFFADSRSSNTSNQDGLVKSEQTTETETVFSDKQMVFSDEFNNSEFSSTKWATCYDWKKTSETGCTNHGNFEQEWYTEDNIVVEDGQLILIAKKGKVDVAVQNQAKSFEYTSGMISSGRGSTNGTLRWAGTYGYFEAKMKVETGQGVWPAFWLLPIDKEWPPEIDIMEFIGSKPGEILQTLHWADKDSPKKSEVVVKDQEDYSSDWHTYGVNWQPNRIDWYIDGVITRSYEGSGIPSEPMEVILNLAIGGLLPGNADETTPLYRELRVDYVRVYQYKDQIRPYQT